MWKNKNNIVFWFLPTDEFINRLPEAIDGKISLVDLAGREMQVLHPQSNFSAGDHRVEINLQSVPEGIYLITLYSDADIQTKRLIVSR